MFYNAYVLNEYMYQEQSTCYNILFCTYQVEKCFLQPIDSPYTIIFTAQKKNFYRS